MNIFFEKNNNIKFRNEENGDWGVGGWGVVVNPESSDSIYTDCSAAHQSFLLLTITTNLIDSDRMH